MGIFKYEKQLVKGLLSLHIERGNDFCAAQIENEMRRITGNSEEEHRYLLEEYIQREIDKLENKDGSCAVLGK